MAITTSKSILGIAAALTFAAVSAPASAGDLFGPRDGGSIKDAPAEAPARRCEFSINAGGTSDYVFRGITQSGERIAFQGGADVGCGMFYAGVWGSEVDFAPYEVDFYAGIKPTWGPLTFDLGVIYYAYPGANDAGAELDYVELKGGVSGTWNKFTLGGVLFWSPDYTAETGNTITLEGSAAYELPAMGPISPSVSALVGTTQFTDGGPNGQLDYVYWNAGLTLGVDKISFDFRYWDSNGGVGDFCGDPGLCDERFVFTAKVALP